MQMFSTVATCQAETRDGRLSSILEAIRDLPFALTPDRSVSFLLRHGMGSCTAKHQLLDQVLRQLGLPSRVVYLLIEYDRSCLKFHEFSSLIQQGDLFPHTAVEVKTSGGWKLLDLTFDQYISAVAPVNWDLSLGGSIGKVRKRAIHQSEHLGRRGHLKVAANFAEPTQQQQRHAKQLNRGLTSVRRPSFGRIIANHNHLLDQLRHIKFVDTANACPSM